MLISQCFFVWINKKLLFQVLNNRHVHSLRKHEILRKKELISGLFTSGKSVKGSFLRVVYASLKPENNIFQGVPALLLAVSKKTLPSAVRRNRVIRMMREAYRLEKSPGQSNGETPGDSNTGEMLCIAFLYMRRGKILPRLGEFREEIRILLDQITVS